MLYRQRESEALQLIEESKEKNGKLSIIQKLKKRSFINWRQTFYRLENTWLVYSVANIMHVSTATQLPYNIGILPGRFVTQNIDEYLQRIDIVKKFMLNLIDK